MKHRRETTQTSAERKFADALRGRKLKFNENQMIENYEVDFWFPDYQLAIEIDGFYHLSETKRELDRRKDHFFMEKGILLIRFDNQQIRENLDRCVQEVQDLMAKIIALKRNCPINDGWKAALKTIRFPEPKPAPKSTQSIEDYFLNMDDDPEEK